MGCHEKHTQNVMYGVKFIQYGNSILFPNIIHKHHTGQLQCDDEDNNK